MKASSERVPKPAKQNGRPFAGGGRSITFVNHDASTDITERHRVQHLQRRFGLAPTVASAIASLAFEGAAA